MAVAQFVKALSYTPESREIDYSLTKVISKKVKIAGA
jgi:hypothetical protein